MILYSTTGSYIPNPDEAVAPEACRAATGLAP